MTLLQIRNIVDYVLTLGGLNAKLTRYRFQDIIQLAHLQYFEEQVRKKNWDNLRPFIHVAGPPNSAALVVTNGVMQLPRNFYQHVSAFTVVLIGNRSVNRVVEKVDNEIYDSRISNAVTRDYPVINYQYDYKNEQGYARVSPVSIKRIALTYLINPDVYAPIYAQKIQGGVNVYDADSSVELIWSEDCQVDILMLVLQHLGIKMNRPEMYQIVQEQKIKEEQTTV